MAHDTDVGGGSLPEAWRRPLAGGRSVDTWLEDRTEWQLQALAQRPERARIPKEKSL